MADPANRNMGRLMSLLRVPVLGRAASWVVTSRMKKHHFGQVLPLEDVRRVFGLVDAIHCFPCVCRRYLRAPADERYCFALGNFFKDILQDMPDLGGFGAELTAEEACARAEAFEQKGLIHTIWTLETPFIIGICSCRPGECLALELLRGCGTQTMFKAEVRFGIDAHTCVGCRKCEETCYFDAIRFDERTRVCVIDAERCYGCGLCRGRCPVDAPQPAARNPAALGTLSAPGSAPAEASGTAD
jgi:ferredoxin